MLRSLHTVSSGARHAIQPHLLSIQFLFLRSFVYKTAAKPNPKKKRSVIYPSLHGVLERYNTMQCNAMQCNAMQWHSPALEKTLCHAPFLAYGVLGRSPCHPAPSSEHTVLLFLAYGVFGRSPCHPAVPNAMECNTIHYNTMQCNAMQCNAMAQPNARKNAMSCSVPRIRCPRALAMPSSSIMQCNAVQYNTLQYNAMQCNAMQCNGTAQR